MNPSNGKKRIERTTTAVGVLRGSIGTTTAVYTHSRMGGKERKGKNEILLYRVLNPGEDE